MSDDDDWPRMDTGMIGMIPSIPDTFAEARAKMVLAQQNLETMLSAAEHCVEAGAPNAAISHLIAYLKAIAPHTFAINPKNPKNTYGGMPVVSPDTACETCGVIRQLHG